MYGVKMTLFSKMQRQRGPIEKVPCPCPNLSYINNKRFSTKSRAKLPKKVKLAVILLVVESANIPSVDSSLLAAASPSTWLWGGGYSQQPLTQIAFHSLCNCFTMANLTTSFCTFSMEKRISLYNCCLELELDILDNVDKSSFGFLSWVVITERDKHVWLHLYKYKI